MTSELLGRLAPFSPRSSVPRLEVPGEAPQPFGANLHSLLKDGAALLKVRQLTRQRIWIQSQVTINRAAVRVRPGTEGRLEHRGAPAGPQIPVPDSYESARPGEPQKLGPVRTWDCASLGNGRCEMCGDPNKCGTLTASLGIDGRGPNERGPHLDVGALLVLGTQQPPPAPPTRPQSSNKHLVR